MSIVAVKERGETLELGFDEARNYHGNVALAMIGVGFRAAQAALSELTDMNGGVIPERANLKVLSGHAGPGIRDAWEYVTRAVTRGAYTVDPNYPAGQYDPNRPHSYAWVVTDTASGAAVEVEMVREFLPAIFFDYLKKGRDKRMTPEDAAAFEQLKRDLCAKSQELPQDDVVSVRRL